MLQCVGPERQARRGLVGPRGGSRLVPVRCSSFGGSSWRGTASGSEATLRWDGTKTGLAGQSVDLWGYAAGRWDKIATATSTSTGTVSFTAAPSFTTKYQLRYAERVVGEVTASASTSSSTTVKVTAKVKLSTPTKVKKGATTTVTGSVSPSLAGRTVSIVVNKKVVAKVSTDSSGAFTAKVKYAKGKSSVYAKVATSSFNEGASSSTYKVKAS